MDSQTDYRRPVLLHRPWITGKLYDDYSRLSILHCDAYVVAHGEALKYLVIDWHEGGRVRIATDAWLIQDDGLTPVWDALRVWNTGVPVIWTRANDATMRRVHKRVVICAAELAAQGDMLTGRTRWARVAIQAHYVRVRDTDCEVAANGYTGRATGDNAPMTMQERLLAGAPSIGKRRGRPPRVRLPDWL